MSTLINISMSPIIDGKEMTLKSLYLKYNNLEARVVCLSFIESLQKETLC